MTLSTDIEIRKTVIRQWLKDKPSAKSFELEAHLPEIREFDKKDLDSVLQLRRRLPHWELDGSTYFLTFRVAGIVGIPFMVLAGSSRDVDDAQIANTCASIVEESIIYGYGERYDLHAYVIMPDHVHILLEPLTDWPLSRILKGIKGFTAREINKVLNRTGSFWQDENMDHIIRDADSWLEKFHYIHNNPVEAGLVESLEDWPFSSLVTLHSIGRLESLQSVLGYSAGTEA